MALQRCSRCILPETFPRITFNADGVCNYCTSYKGYDQQEALKTHYRQKFETLLKQMTAPSTLPPAPSSLSPTPSSSSPAPYQVLMAYSGGKDSTYTLYLLREKYNLTVLALSLDNGFLSPVALQNMKSVCDNLSVDHMLFTPRRELLKKIFSSSVDRNLFGKATIERASTICSACMGIVKFITLKLAVEKNIPFIGYGWSPGQAPVQSSVMKLNAKFMRSSQKLFYEPLHNIAGDDIKPYFLDESDFKKLDKGVYNIHPLAFLEYNETKIFQKIKELGWTQPDDTDSNSSNCLLNSFANQVHIKKYGFHPYAFEIAGLVRAGILTRDEGIKKIEAPQDEKTIKCVKNILGL